MARVADGITGVLTVLVLLAAAGSVAALFAGNHPQLNTLSHFALVYAAMALVGAAWAILAGKGPLAAGSVVALVASGFLMRAEFSRDLGPRAPAAAPGQIKVIQINALRKNADIGRVADWLIAQHPDVVTVTEARHDLRDLLIKRTGWGTAGAHGDLIIFTPRHYTVMHRPSLPPGSELTFVNATYQVGGQPAELVSTHLAWPNRPMVPRQRRELEGVIDRLPRGRMILTGDFNDTPWSDSLQALDRDLGLTRRDRAVATFPAQVLGVRWPLPFLPIDHIYAGPGWATVKVERGPWLGSDHYPLIVTLAPVALR